MVENVGPFGTNCSDVFQIQYKLYQNCITLLPEFNHENIITSQFISVDG